MEIRETKKVQINFNRIKKVIGMTGSNSKKSLEEAVAQALEIVRREKKECPEPGAGFFFRGVKRNYDHGVGFSTPIGSAFQSGIDRNRHHVENERKMYEETMRYNVASFQDDTTMTDRITRMQHYQLPTRFADVSTNFLQSLLFAVGGCDPTAKEAEKYDGFVRVIKVAPHKMKSFTSDIIVAISHLPLVDCDRIDVEADKGLDTLRYEVMKERTAFGFSYERKGENARLQKEIQQVWAFKPRINNARIRNQDGLFLAFGCRSKKESLKPTFSREDYVRNDQPSYGIMQIGAVQIEAGSKATILEELRMFGMEEEVVYPELSDVCQKIKSRYSV